MEEDYIVKYKEINKEVTNRINKIEMTEGEKIFWIGFIVVAFVILMWKFYLLKVNILIPAIIYISVILIWFYLISINGKWILKIKENKIYIKNELMKYNIDYSKLINIVIEDASMHYMDNLYNRRNYGLHKYMRVNLKPKDKICKITFLTDNNNIKIIELRLNSISIYDMYEVCNSFIRKSEINIKDSYMFLNINRIEEFEKNIIMSKQKEEKSKNKISKIVNSIILIHLVLILIYILVLIKYILKVISN